MKKNILIDCTPLRGSYTGIAKYIDENVNRLKQDNEKNWFYYYDGLISQKLITAENLQQDFPYLSKLKNYLSSKTLFNRYFKKPLKKLLSLGRELFVNNKKQTYHLYWQPNYIVEPSINAFKTVVTVHDFSFYEHPQWHPQDRLELFNQHFMRNIHQADKIICDSHYIKSCAIKRLNLNEQDIEVIYLGIEHEIFKQYPQQKLIEVKQKFSLPERFILFVGSIEPRKNLLNLLKAYHLLPELEKNNTQLILVGFKGWENQEIMAQINAEKQHINYLGYVSDQELAMIYNLATVFVYPSFYEGFGIPPLEAMACGCPVIVSNSTSMPEVCAEAALYIHPQQVDDISQCLMELLQDTQLQQLYIKKGLKHVQQFCWEKSAQQHMNLFERLLNTP